MIPNVRSSWECEIRREWNAWKMDKKSLLFLTIWGFLTVHSQKQIPEFLRECYEDEIFRGPKLPMNFQVLIDLVRKAEKYSKTSMDMRVFTTSLLHRFKFDGIENYSGMRVKEGVLPFGGTGSQRAKNRLIEELVPGNPSFFPSEALTIHERCALHRAISNSIRDHDDPGHEKLCYESVTEKLSDRSLLGERKVCPLEFGVILTQFGTIAPGAVISAIAASLQPQNVTVRLLLEKSLFEASADTKNENENNDEDQIDLVLPRSEMTLDRSMWLSNIEKSDSQIDNVWIATVAGDLAEMVVYQGPVEGKHMMLGATGYWNSSMRPSIFYIVGKDGTFDATRAEIIGGIDGLIIAKKIGGWINEFPNLRLSQVLDIYYSERGTNFDTSTRACDRGKIFWNYAPISLLEDQIFAASQILAYRKSVAYMDEDYMRNMVKLAVEKFHSFAIKDLSNELRCPEIEKLIPTLEAIVVIDGAWSRDYTADFLSVLVDDLQVSPFGSKIGLIHGSTGEWIFNVTDSPANVHYVLSNFENYTWPLGINFEKVLNQTSNYLDTIWKSRRESHTIGNLGQALIFLAPRAGFNTVEQQDILKIIQKLKENHPDLHFIYYVSEGNSKLFFPFLSTEEDHLVRTSSLDDVTERLQTVTKILRPAECNSKIEEGVRDQVEDYVSPRNSVTYRLHPHWRKNTKKVTVTVHTVGYGTIEICSWTQRRNNIKKNNLYCRHVSGHSEVVIDDFSDCNENVVCNTTYYKINGISSKKKCSEIDCRTPEYVRYILRMENLHCSKGTKGFSSFSSILLLVVASNLFIRERNFIL